jgi:hypothetical protein
LNYNFFPIHWSPKFGQGWQRTAWNNGTQVGGGKVSSPFVGFGQKKIAGLFN